LSDKVRTSTEFPNCYLRSIIEGRIDAYQFLLADENPLPQTTILKIGAHGFVCGNLTIELNHGCTHRWQKHTTCQTQCLDT